MRKLFKKRLLGIPIALLLVLALTAGVVATGYVVIQGTVTVGVNEAFTVHYSLDGAASSPTWVSVTNGFAIPITGAYPGDCMTIWVKITNASSNTLKGEVSVAPRTPAAFDLSGMTSALFNGGMNIPPGETVRSFPACVAVDVPAPITYTIDISVLRG